MRAVNTEEWAPLSAILALVILHTGCDGGDKSGPYELLKADNGLVYRINKASGQVSLIAGTQVTTLDEWGGTKNGEPKRSYLRNWPETTMNQLGDLSLVLKTTWRDGTLLYVLRACPYAGRLEAERNSKTSAARFNLNFNDADGFQVLSIPVEVAEMTRELDEKGVPSALSVNSSTSCTVGTYESIKGWSAGWAGFSQ
jgi:hypothetical protein